MARRNSCCSALTARRLRDFTSSGVSRAAAQATGSAPRAGATTRGASAPTTAPSREKSEAGATKLRARAAARRASRPRGVELSALTGIHSGPRAPHAAAARSVA